MARKVKFPLEMDGGIMVRDIEGLRENFSLQRILGYFANGKLSIWLRDRYENEIADAIEELKEDDAELARKVCEILGVSYDENYREDMEAVVERNRKMTLLKQYTMEQEYIDNVDSVAFEQDDVDALSVKDVNIIYLCGEKFSIPLAVHGKKYIGVNSPKVVIDSNEEIDFEERNITFENVEFDDKYIGVLQENEQSILKRDNKYGEFVKDEIRHTKIDEMELSVRTYNCLKRAGIQTLGDLMDKTSEDMIRIRNLGSKSFEEVLAKMAEYGATLLLSDSEKTALKIR